MADDLRDRSGHLVGVGAFLILPAQVDKQARRAGAENEGRELRLKIISVIVSVLSDTIDLILSCILER